MVQKEEADKGAREVKGGKECKDKSRMIFK